MSLLPFQDPTVFQWMLDQNRSSRSQSNTSSPGNYTTPLPGNTTNPAPGNATSTSPGNSTMTSLPAPMNPASTIDAWGTTSAVPTTMNYPSSNVVQTTIAAENPSSITPSGTLATSANDDAPTSADLYGRADASSDGETLFELLIGLKSARRRLDLGQ